MMVAKKGRHPPAFSCGSHKARDDRDHGEREQQSAHPDRKFWAEDIAHFHLPPARDSLKLADITGQLSNSIWVKSSQILAISWAQVSERDHSLHHGAGSQN